MFQVLLEGERCWSAVPPFWRSHFLRVVLWSTSHLAYFLCYPLLALKILVISPRIDCRKSCPAWALLWQKAKRPQSWFFNFGNLTLISSVNHSAKRLWIPERRGTISLSSSAIQTQPRKQSNKRLYPLFTKEHYLQKWSPLARTPKQSLGWRYWWREQENPIHDSLGRPWFGQKGKEWRWKRLQPQQGCEHRSSLPGELLHWYLCDNGNVTEFVNWDHTELQR